MISIFEEHGSISNFQKHANLKIQSKISLFFCLLKNIRK